MKRLALGIKAFAALGVLTLIERAAEAQGDPRRSVDPYEPAEHGSEWFAGDSLDLRGRARPSLGYVIALTHRSYVVSRSGDGAGERAPVKDLATLHVGGSLVLADRVRVGFDMPFQLYAGGESAVDSGTAVPAPPKEGGFGDLRLGSDVRVFGEHGRGVTGAVGLQVWLPTGQKSQWASDGTLRAQPRALLAGTHGIFVWTAQLGVLAREGSLVTLSATAGVRLSKGFVIGPEVFASSMFDDLFAQRTTPVEGIFGLHWLIDGTARLGLGVSHGFTDAIGAPSARGLFSIEWAPDLPSANKPRPGKHDPSKTAPPDTDHDGIPDDRDACPLVPGIATNRPKDNGCPPDADGDGIDDLADACPTTPGPATHDPATNGCPVRDRDKDGVLDEVDACPDDAGPSDSEPRRNGCPKAFVHNARIELLDPVAWKGPASAELAAGPENEALLTAVLSVMLKIPETSKLRVEGHTDDRGDPQGSRKLSAARAAAVAKWLSDHGIDGQRITSEGWGGDRPVTTNETEVGRAENRRLELHLVP